MPIWTAPLDAVVFMIYSLNGERCTSSSRLLIQEGIAENRPGLDRPLLGRKQLRDRAIVGWGGATGRKWEPRGPAPRDSPPPVRSRGGTAYFFRVRAYSNSTGNYSAFSTIATVTTPAFPSQPASVTATATAEGTITLTWADTTNETGYRLERSLNGTTGWSQVGTPAANATSFSDTGLAENTRYYYRLIALNAAGASAPSLPANAVTPLSTPGERGGDRRLEHAD